MKKFKEIILLIVILLLEVILILIKPSYIKFKIDSTKSIELEVLF
ncbi:hypothetical protein [Clostridium tetani]